MTKSVNNFKYSTTCTDDAQINTYALSADIIRDMIALVSEFVRC